VRFGFNVFVEKNAVWISRFPSCVCQSIRNANMARGKHLICMKMIFR
jgi:hypothetical protein